MQTELSQECESLRKELELCKTNEVEKEACLNELKRQCEELSKTRSIELNLLMNKPKETTIVAKQQSSDEGKSKPAGGSKLKDKASKNLQFAKDLNAEMELMFADDDFKIGTRPQRRQKKQASSKQKQVQFQQHPAESKLDLNSGTVGANRLLPMDTLLQNQIQAAMLAESLIEEIKLMENSQSTEVCDLKNSCTSLEIHAKTLTEEKNHLSEKVTDLGKTNDDLKRKFSALLDQF